MSVSVGSGRRAGRLGPGGARPHLRSRHRAGSVVVVAPPLGRPAGHGGFARCGTTPRRPTTYRRRAGRRGGRVGARPAGGVRLGPRPASARAGHRGRRLGPCACIGRPLAVSRPESGQGVGAGRRHTGVGSFRRGGRRPGPAVPARPRAGPAVVGPTTGPGLRRAQPDHPPHRHLGRRITLRRQPPNWRAPSTKPPRRESPWTTAPSCPYFGTGPVPSKTPGSPCFLPLGGPARSGSGWPPRFDPRPPPWDRRARPGSAWTRWSTSSGAPPSGEND